MTKKKRARIIPFRASKIRSINPNKEELTVENIRQFAGMDKLSKNIFLYKCFEYSAF